MTDAVELISEDTLSAVCAYHLDAARLRRLDRTLADAALLERGSLLTGAKGRSYVDSLLSRRDELLSGLDGYRVMKDPGPILRPSWVDGHLADIFGQLASGWWNMKVPRIQPGLCFAPETSSASGSIEMGYTGNGIVGIDADLAQSGGKGPQDEEYWLCSWQWTAVFEPAPADGFLSYRFGVDTRFTPYFASAISGGIYAWLSTGVASDEAQQLGHWREVMPWPVDVALPHQQQVLHLGRDATISGWISVKQGHRAKLGLIAGVVVGLAGGRCTLFSSDSSFVTHKVGSQYLADLGRIEYRFDSSLLARLVDDEVSLQPKHFP